MGLFARDTVSVAIAQKYPAHGNSVLTSYSLPGLHLARLDGSLSNLV